MKMSEKTKRDMAKCAKRVSEVIECFCEAGELVECADDDRYELIGGISCIRQLEQEIKQKDERIRQLEREREAFMELVRGHCYACKHYEKSALESPCKDCGDCKNDDGSWEFCGVEEKHEQTD